MVKISNGKSELLVPSGAFKMIYKGLGFKIVGEKNGTDSEDADDGAENKNEENSGSVSDDDFIEQLVEKPIGEWSKEEVKKFAELKGIDISETKKVTEAKNLIRSFLELNEA